MDVVGYIFEENNPAGIKAVLDCLGICNKEVRLPLVVATPNLQEKIANFILHYELTNN